MSRNVREPGAGASFSCTRPRAWLALAAVVLAAAGCTRPARTDDPGAQADRALQAATRALVAAQAADGAWRSRVYGAMQDGLSLTPPNLKAVLFAPEVPGSAEARRRGAEFLVRCVRPDGSIDGGEFGLGYPVYTASLAVMALTVAKVPDADRARADWLRLLRARQLTEDLGWAPTDAAYGAWGDAFEPALKRPDAEASGWAIEADISSTLFAVSALRMAGAGADDPAVRKALAFIERCQNHAEAPGEGDAAFHDGGFFFSPTNPMRNKAGIAGVDGAGRTRFRSYGSTTADGLRALLRCGASLHSPRVLAARRWLETHFSATANPGQFDPAREVEREGTYYYYCWSVAHAFRALGVVEIPGPAGPFSWSQALARELMRRQRSDGTWASRHSSAREDDPLVATPLAAGALGSCRLMLAR